MENRGCLYEKQKDNYWIVLWRSYHNRNIFGANSDEKAGGKKCPAGRSFNENKNTYSG